MLKEFLIVNRNRILDRWFQSILETYPADTRTFMKSEKNRFQNPVGDRFQKEIVTIYDELTGGMDDEKISSSLDEIIKIRSVQEFSPSQALDFIYLLKKSIQKELESSNSEDEKISFFIELDTITERLTGEAFNIYTRCRERIYDIKVNEIKARSHRLIERANRLYGSPPDDQCDLPEENA